MGKKESKGPTPEDWARWRSNEERLYELANKGLAELGITREELDRRLGVLSSPDRRRPPR